MITFLDVAQHFFFFKPYSKLYFMFLAAFSYSPVSFFLYPSFEGVGAACDYITYNWKDGLLNAILCYSLCPF